MFQLHVNQASISKGKIRMLFYGGTFLHNKKFVNKYLWLCAHVNKRAQKSLDVYTIFRKLTYYSYTHKMKLFLEFSGENKQFNTFSNMTSSK